MKKPLYLIMTIITSLLFFCTAVPFVFLTILNITSITSKENVDIVIIIGETIGELLVVVLLGIGMRYFIKKYRKEV